MGILNSNDRKTLNDLVDEFNRELDGVFGSDINVRDLSPTQISAYFQEAENRQEVEEIKRLIRDLVNSYLNNIKLIIKRVSGFEQSVSLSTSELSQKVDKGSNELVQFQEKLVDFLSLVNSKSDVAHSHTDYSTADHNHNQEYSTISHPHPDLIKTDSQLINQIQSLQEKKVDKGEPVTPATHAKSHIMGQDQIPLATEKNRGLASPQLVKKADQALKIANEAVNKAKVLISGVGSGSSGTTINELNDVGDVDLTSIAQGDILHNDGSNWVNLGAGTNGYFLKTQGSGADPVWAQIAGGGDMLISTYDPASVSEQLIGLTATQTLTNKTLTSPIISSISNTGIITLPTSTDTLVGRDTTDTLTNKIINTASNTITILEADISDLQSYLTSITGLAPDTATTQAAQPNITSLGTLTTLTVDNLTLNGNAITSDLASALTITANAGQAVTIEGISIDGGVVTGASSVSSTGFTGDVTGNCSGTAATVTGATQASITTCTNLTTVGTVVTGDVDAVVSAANLTTAGKVELATVAETTTGTDATRAVTPDGLAGSIYGQKDFCIVTFGATTAISTGNGTVGFAVPATLNGMDITAVIATVDDKGITGTTDVQVRRTRGGADADVLSTKVTIGDEWFAADGVINISNDDLLTGDIIYVDVDAIHSGTAPNGLSVTITVTIP